MSLINQIFVLILFLNLTPNVFKIQIIISFIKRFSIIIFLFKVFFKIFIIIIFLVKLRRTELSKIFNI